MGQWSDDVKYGMTMEQKVCDELNARIPHWKVESWGGKDQPDFKCQIGYGEIKSYNDWYRQPMIEYSNMTTNKPSVWVTDTTINIMVVNHGEWLHLYNCSKLRYCCEEGHFSWHYKDVKQGDLDQWKKMKFLHVNKSSTLRDATHNEDTDPQRWDCSHIHEKINPYITSIRKDWTSIEKK